MFMNYDLVIYCSGLCLLYIYIQYLEPLPGVDSTDRLQEPYGSPVHFNAELKTDEKLVFFCISRTFH